ncbi:hypothetical protein Tco_1302550 [Tanacetum coccineum]
MNESIRKTYLKVKITERISTLKLGCHLFTEIFSFVESRWVRQIRRLDVFVLGSTVSFVTSLFLFHTGGGNRRSIVMKLHYDCNALASFHWVWTVLLGKELDFELGWNCLNHRRLGAKGLVNKRVTFAI